MSEVTITEDDKALIKAYLNTIYDGQATNWTINDKVAGVVEVMLRESEKCSESMDVVPRPHNITGSGLSYIRKQLLGIAKRTTKRHIYEIKKQYVVCSLVLKLAYRTPLSMARSGL